MSTPEQPSPHPNTEELDVLRLLAEGLTDEAVMRRLGLSRRTLERRLKAGMRKLRARSRFQGGFLLALSGWIEDVQFPPPGPAGIHSPGNERAGR